MPFSKKDLFAFLSAALKKKGERDKLIRQFEDSFASYIGVGYGIGVSCGKMALYLCLRALKAKPGDEIIVPAYTVPEVIEVIILCEMRPVFVDINLEDGNIDTDLIEEKIGKHTKFILMTHIHGYPCKIDEILKIAEKYNLDIIEDSAQGCGAEYQGKKTGSFGKLGYFSFGIFKNFNTLGGGMIVTNDFELASSLNAFTREFRPQPRKEVIKRLLWAGVFSVLTHPVFFAIAIYPVMRIIRLTWKDKMHFFLKSKTLTRRELDKLKVKFAAEQAAIGLRGLKNIDDLNDEKIKKAKLLNQELSGLDKVQIFKERSQVRNIYLNYIIRVKDREKIIDYLFNQGIDVSPGFVVSCAHLKKFEKFGCDCQNSLILENQNLYIPIYPPLKAKSIARIGKLIKNGY